MSRNGVMETHRLPPNTMQIIVFNSASGEKRAKESGLTVHGYGCLCCWRFVYLRETNAKKNQISTISASEVRPQLRD